MEATYQGISRDEENQNTQTSSDETEDASNLEGMSEKNDGIPTCRYADVQNETRYWKCLTSEYFLFGVPALPIMLAALILLSLIVNYSIAVSLGHVAAFLPYVSWLGSQSPEEYIFDFIMSLAAINVAFIIYFKFKIIADNYHGPQKLAVMVINKACAWIGLLSSLLFLMSSTFPAILDDKRIQKVHSVASISAFSLICLYFIIETVISFKIQYRLCRVTLCVSITRAVFAVLAPVCLITAAITGKLSYKYFKGEDDKKWGPNDGGYALHVTAAFCEWALVLLMVAFFLTYISELRCHVTEVKVAFVQQDCRRGRRSSDSE